MKKGKGAGYLPVLMNWSFCILFMGQLISYLGDRLDQFTLLELARTRLESSDGSGLSSDTLMNIMTMGLLIPFVLLAPLVGPVIDRFSRKTILIVTSFCQGAVILSIPIFRDTAFVQDHAVLLIFSVIFAIGCFTTFFTPAKTALIAEIVPSDQLMAANSLTTFAGTIMNMLGALVAAEMLNHFKDNLNICFYLDTATYVISGLMFFLIFVPDTPEIRAMRASRREETRISFFRQIALALTYLKAHGRPMKAILLNGAFAAVAGLVYSLINAKVLGEMEAETETYGLLMGVFGLALICGGLLMTLFHRRLSSYEEFIAGAFVVVGGCIWWIAAAPDLFIPVREPWAARASRIYLRVVDGRLHLTSSIIPIFLVGLVGGAIIVYIVTMLQKSVPKRLHGRIFALSNLVYFACLIALNGVGIGLQQLVRREILTLSTVGMIGMFFSLIVTFGVVMWTEWLRFVWLRRLVYLPLRLFCGLRVVGRENVPVRGPLIVAGNHVSWLDTVFIGVAVPRIVHYMAASTYYYRLWLRPIMVMFGAIPVQSDRNASGVLRAAISIVERNRVFGLFPEGALSRDGSLQPAKGGIGLIARRTGVGILPVALIGAYDVYPVHQRFPRPGRVTVRIGARIDPTGMERDEVTERVMQAIQALMEEGHA